MSSIKAIDTEPMGHKELYVIIYSEGTMQGVILSFSPPCLPPHAQQHFCPKELHFLPRGVGMTAVAGKFPNFWFIHFSGTPEVIRCEQ